jgi:hypothetical protein
VRKDVGERYRWLSLRRTVADQRKLKQGYLETEPDGRGNFPGFENIHDLADVGLDVRRGVAIKEEKKIQEKATDLRRKFFVPDLR